MIDAYPLSWPLGYKRTISRTQSAFKQLPDKAQLFLRDELNRLGAKEIIVSSNVPQRKDGMLYADMTASNISDPGIAIYFKYKNQDIVMCCDRYLKPWENIYALGKGIEALRGMERWGVSEFMQRAFTGFKALPESVDSNPQAWYEVLGVPPNANAHQIKEAYRRMAQIHHPDSGGDSAMFSKINKAYQQGLSSLVQ